GGLGQGSEEDPADDDHSLGIPNPGDNDEASGISGDLNALFKSGADVPLSFSISAANLLNLPVLLSNGDPLSYSVSEDGHTLTATAGSGESLRTVFTLTIDELGGWHFDLDDQLDHVEDGNTEGFGLITVSTSGEGPEYGSVYGIDFSSIIVATDADGDPAVGAVGGSFVVMVQDDVPEVVAQPRAISAMVEEDDMTGIAGGDLSTGNNEDDSVNRDEADSTDHGSIATLFSAGADAPLSFSLSTTTDSLPTLYSQGDAVSYRVEDNVLTAYVDGGEDADRVVFTLTLDDNGGWSFDLLDQLDHVNDGANDENTALYTGEDSEPVSSIDFSSLLQATDADGDTVTLGERSGLFRIAIQDDVPVVTAISSLIYANSLNDGSSDAVGVFAYRLGADEWDDYSAQRSDFAAISLSGMVGELAISNTDVSWSSEDATTASFVIAFDYAANPDTPELLTHVTGSLVFDKEAGTYTLSLDDTIKGYTVLTTSNPIGERDSHDLTGSPQPEIVISQLDNNFYVRFSGGSGDFATSDGDMVLEDNEVFTGTQKWVSISGDENGIASDTLQRGEVLNMDFYTSNPGADPNPAAGDARADGIYLKLAKWIPGEDMLVLLKLIDPDNPLDTITRTIIVSSADIYTADEGNPYGITGADGVVIIESNDYNGAGENYQIYGIQLLVSSEDIIGSGIDLNRETGESGGSSSMLDFDANPADTGTTDQDVIKIMDVGIITSQSYTQDAQLSFDVTLADADGDHSASQQLDVYIASSGTLSGSAGADVMTGDSGPNSFVWHAGDASDTAGAPITDTVVNFSLAQGDSLDLHDLLQGEAGQDLGKYLHFSSDGNDTLIQVSSSGQFDGSNYSAVADQNILLQGVDLTTLGNDSQIIDQLKGGHNLQTD
ncbi:type I secretion C-terminal target domain-containing protein, partial [Vogesella amnigena]